MTVLDRLKSLSDGDESVKTFGAYEEEAIIALALDHPEFITGMIHFMKPEYFQRLECRYVIAELLNNYERFGIVPTRAILRDKIESQLTSSDPFEVILNVLDRESNPREIPLIKDSLLKWAKTKAYGMLYSEEAISAYNSGDYELIEKIVNEANRIADVGAQGFWFLDNFEILFMPDAIEHYTTGFKRLDNLLNGGGPSPKEVVCWLAPTNVGKSVFLVNNAISSLRDHKDVLFITFEMSVLKTALRAIGTATGVPLNDISDRQEMVTRVLNSMKLNLKKRLLIHEMPPEECSVAHIYALLDSLKRTEGWRPNVIILDYLDLMVSRNGSYNQDTYTRQKMTASEVRGLAIKENVLVFTATQTNRSGAAGEEVADMTKAADSFAKQFSLDYVISLNQSQQERVANPPRLRMFIAKNRNGPKHELIQCEIQYETMVVREV